MLTLILVFMEWPPRLHVLYIATAAAASFAYDPFRRYDMPELHEGKSMSVEREEGYDGRWFGFVLLTQEWKTNISMLGLAPEQRSAFAAIPAQYLL